MKHFLFYLLVFVALFVSCNKDDGDNDNQPHRTLIIYMAADNNLSADAWDNIRDMESGFTEKGANLVVFVDTADDSPQMLKIRKGGSDCVKTYPEFNSTDVGQMRQVLSDIINSYPASSYGLVLWSHGASWLPAGSRLRSFGEDSGKQMNISDLAANLPVKFDFILFDACLMGSVEVAYELRNKTDYILASSTETIYLGFPYKQIVPELLNPNPDLRKVATDYFNSYDRLVGTYRSATVSVIDTKELENLAAVTAQLIGNQAFDAGAFNRESVQRLDVYGEQYTFDFLDFLEKAFPDADFRQLEEQLSKTVLYKAHTPEFIEEYAIETFCGLSCFVPHPKREDLNEFYQGLGWCLDSGFWRLF